MSTKKIRNRVLPYLIQKQALRLRALLIISLVAVFVYTFIYLNLTSVNKTEGATLSFTSASLTSGALGAVNSVHKFANIVSGVDAQVTLTSLNNGASLSSIDIPASSTGYEIAFQPYITLAGGNNGNPKNSYIEWTIRFKKAGTNTDTIISDVSATAIDVDGNSNQQEWIEAFGATSYSTYSPSELIISTTATSVKAFAPTNDYSGIDSVNKQVMFQINWTNVSSIVYRTGGINKNPALSRQFSIYFKPFFNTSSPLPVDLLKFEGKLMDENQVQLNWSTASERNNDYFSIERSSNSEHFTKIGQVKGAGNASVVLNYEFVDEQPMDENNYYRLSQTDFNGDTKHYNPICIKRNNSEEEFMFTKAAPNPFANYINVNYTASDAKSIIISLVNSVGKEVASKNVKCTKGNNTYTFENLAHLPEGIYFIAAKEKGKDCKALKVIKH